MNVLILLLPIIAAPNLEVLSKETIYSNSFTNPRNPQSSLTLTSDNIDACFGSGFSIARLEFEKFELEIDIEGGVWITLDHLESTSFALKTEDFLFAIPLAFRINNFSAALKYNHISAHLGDGAEKRERITYSRDFISAQVTVDFLYDLFISTLYVSGGYAFIIYPEELLDKSKRFYFGVGNRILYLSHLVSPYAAFDITFNSDMNSLDISTQVGIAIIRSHKIYAAIYTYSGSDRRGQRLGDKLSQAGFTIMFEPSFQTSL